MKHRKTNRLAGYDYSQSGMYFVTICARERENIFGKIENGKVVLNEVGEIIQKEILNIGNGLKNILVDCYIVMPNHVHFIIDISFDVGADLVSAQNLSGQTQGLSLHNSDIGLLSRIIQKFKSVSTVKYIHLMKSKNRSCITKIWQRSFYDHIIRNEIELNKIREYIYKNPANWELDRNKNENILL
jgi:REP element-mobilizing transposase RayT